mmetsp:Transcript_14417/g.21914  ORF Transcript_14417/g.21914 Transcript_14417/m.21914 type:complete len:309 (+) Transcript_14417:250-1176(+)|eukprot:CAMPEP_0167753924 /NCGR_PEP_ID=MMETSP0110_2-20121227/7985_1 /TAXON_ID=629695 /ORGANISM="Gymnochlora sp., Strain CCMP2014" /LENGTH=308 /DNA_ID=CAMNT_0007639747 /DNA_START=241 /DNA_END=1167 /DNA_ORIENTATION=-
MYRNVDEDKELNKEPGLNMDMSPISPSLARDLQRPMVRIEDRITFSQGGGAKTTITNVLKKPHILGETTATRAEFNLSFQLCNKEDNKPLLKEDYEEVKGKEFVGTFGLWDEALIFTRVARPEKMMDGLFITFNYEGALELSSLIKKLENKRLNHWTEMGKRALSSKKETSNRFSMKSAKGKYFNIYDKDGKHLWCSKPKKFIYEYNNSKERKKEQRKRRRDGDQSNNTEMNDPAGSSKRQAVISIVEKHVKIMNKLIKKFKDEFEKACKEELKIFTEEIVSELESEEKQKVESEEKQKEDISGFFNI